MRPRTTLHNQDGTVAQVEILFVMTCGLCIIIVCCGAFGPKIVGEWIDLKLALVSLDHSYSLTGVAVGHPNDPTHPTDIASWAGSAFDDDAGFGNDATCGVRNCQAPTAEQP